MPNKTYSVATKLAGAVLARLKGDNAAATEMKVDRRSIRRWLAAAPDDGWTLARDLAQARLAEQLATGKINASQLATVAGIADRNVRYGELLRQREARKAAEQPVPEPSTPSALQAATDALRDDQQRLIAATIDVDLRDRQVDPAADEQVPLTEAEGEAVLLGWIGEFAKLDEQQVAAALADVHQRMVAIDEKWRAERERAAAALRAPEPPPEPPDVPPEPTDLDEHRGHREAWTSSDGDRLIEVVDGAGRHRHIDPWSPY